MKNNEKNIKEDEKEVLSLNFENLTGFSKPIWTIEDYYKRLEEKNNSLSF